MTLTDGEIEALKRMKNNQAKKASKREYTPVPNSLMEDHVSTYHDSLIVVSTSTETRAKRLHVPADDEIAPACHVSKRVDNWRSVEHSKYPNAEWCLKCQDMVATIRD